jgi:hypothetical protein
VKKDHHKDHAEGKEYPAELLHKTPEDGIQAHRQRYLTRGGLELFEASHNLLEI